MEYERLVDPSGRTRIPEELIHDTAGLGVPHYSAYLHEIFGAFERMALEDDKTVPHVPLTTTTITTVTRAQIDAQWLFYEATEEMTPAQFCNALAIRLNVIPRHLQLLGSKCNCGYVYPVDDAKSLEHLFSCARSSPVSFTTRHNLIRDTIIRVARNFGITCSKEPTCFTYTSGQHRRPDAIALSMVPSPTRVKSAACPSANEPFATACRTTSAAPPPPRPSAGRGRRGSAPGSSRS